MSLKNINYFIKNIELFNALTAINIIILLKYAIKRKSMTCAQHLIMIIKITAFEMNL